MTDRHDLFHRLVEGDGWLCGICGSPIDLDAPVNSGRAASIDHVKPRSQGGPNLLWNMQPAHRDCNSQRGDAAVPGDAT